MEYWNDVILGSICLDNYGGGVKRLSKFVKQHRRKGIKIPLDFAMLHLGPSLHFKAAVSLSVN